MSNVKLFVDFWNFQLGWNTSMGGGRGVPPIKILWKDVPAVLIAELPAIYGATTPFIYRGTNVYASVNPQVGGKDEKLKKFLHNVLGQMTGFRVDVRDRSPKHEKCPHCTQDIHRTVEKGVDTSIVCDLFEGALNDAYDIAILISNDRDFVPAIKTIQERCNKQVIHAGFGSDGTTVRSACWGHIRLDTLSAKLKDPGQQPA